MVELLTKASVRNRVASALLAFVMIVYTFFALPMTGYAVETEVKEVVNNNGSVLVIQDGDPWGFNSNPRLMQNLYSAGYISSYDIITSSNFSNVDLSNYDVIYVVMNSSTMYVSNFNMMYDRLEQFVKDGGSVVYGLAWQSGSYDVRIPGNPKLQYHTEQNAYVVDADHPFVTGELTNNLPFPNGAYANSIIHSHITSLPENANVIIRDSYNYPVVAEYAYGNGNVIISCLTWECFYQCSNSNNNRIFANNSYDDLIVYALSLANGNNGNHKHSYVAGETFAPTCTENGYTVYTCKCGVTYHGSIVPRLNHQTSDWVVTTEPTCTTSGVKHSTCLTCGIELENIYIAPLGHNYVTETVREVTCETPGILKHTCQRCNDSYTTYVYAEHSYEITEQAQPTCYNDGYTVYTCTKCEKSYTEAIPGGHDYESVITKVATSEEDGEIVYTCKSCGDSYSEVIPAREAASVLLVQDKYPWGENNNVALLNKMLEDEYILGWDLVTTADLAKIDVSAYNVILIANDQSTATYNQLNYLNETLVQFAKAGGVVIYGACDHGWSGGDISYSLPEGVVKKNFYSNYNYIVDTNHLIVSGILTDGKSLTDSLLYGNYCSHTAFDISSLPEGANVILQDGHGDATLVEYPVGDGYIILSGLTWEFYYNRNCYDGRTNTSYTKNVYDDLIMYALYLSDPCDHVFDEGVTVDPTCTENGYTLHTCQNCGGTMKSGVIEAPGHVEGEWTVAKEATEYEEGLMQLCCSVCGEVLKSTVIPKLNVGVAAIEGADYVVIGDTVIFTLVIDKLPEINSVSVTPIFDSNIFNIVSAEWLVDAVIQNIEEGSYKSISAWGEPTDINTSIYRITLKVRGFADNTSISFSVLAEDENGVVEISVVPKTVSVIPCPHAETECRIISGAYHADVCTLCGHAVMAEHIYDDVCDSYCEECGYERVAPHAPADEFIYDKDQHWHLCTICGKSAAYENHNYRPIGTIPASCSAEGYTDYLCECGASIKGNIIPKLPHTPGEWVIDIEPTCGVPGRKHTNCTVCDASIDNVYIAPLGHDYVTETVREVSCNEPGILRHTCDNCKHSYVTYVYAEHNYVITEQVQPTCYTDGRTIYTCSGCKDSYTEVIPGGHDYEAVVTKVANAEEEGEITYTCKNCGDYYVTVVPAREAASVLLVQDRYPWSENNNVALLDKMLKDGYLLGWDITTTAEFDKVDISAYNVILIANDQSTATYNQLNYLNDALVQFANAGGVVIYGACDNGWAGGNISYSLPEGVEKSNFYSRYNYIVDADHLIVSGILTDGKSLTNNLLYGNYCSHTAFDAATLPEGANVILQDAHGDATLVEYPVGDGYIILSGLTWEFYYNRNCYDGRTNTSYTKNVYDDLIMYALYLSDPCDHVFDEGEWVDPTCTENGYNLHTCQSCGAHMKTDVVEPLGHVEGEWITVTPPTEESEGLTQLHCANCDEVIKEGILPKLNVGIGRIEGADYVVIGDTVLFTLVIQGAADVNSIAVVPVFDNQIFEIIGAEWLVDALIQNIEELTYKSISTWESPISINTSVYRIALKVVGYADYTDISFTVYAENDGEIVEISVVPKTVSVTDCPHATTRGEMIDDMFHVNICTLCGYAETSEHVYTNPCDATCNDCGYERVAPHAYSDEYSCDGAFHWYDCTLCGLDKDFEEHEYENDKDCDCNDCGFERYLKGDVDGDGDVDSDDSVYLIYHIFFGNEYPVIQSLDYNGDGLETSDDGVYLLYFVFFGEELYPLH